MGTGTRARPTFIKSIRSLTLFPSHISASPDFSNPVLDIVSSIYLAALPVPVPLLDSQTAYYFRARFHDDAGNVSEWTACSQFTTDAGADLNANGIPYHQEIQNTTDLDQNGVTDNGQAGMKCVNTETGDSMICLTLGSSEGNIIAFAAVDPESVSNSNDKPESMPIGLINARIRVENPGDTATVTFYFSKPVPPDTRWFYYNLTDGWDHANSAVFSENRTSLAVDITDGGAGDMDGVQNGVIVFSNGPGTPPLKRSDFNFTAPDDDVDGIGCFFDCFL